MPIYEYMCTNAGCGHELEALQKISDERLVYCPSCGEATLKKKISAAGFRLKGTGWYETDFKNNGKKQAGGKNSTSSDGANSGDSSTGGTKSDGGKSDGGKPDGGKSDGGTKPTSGTNAAA